MAIEWDIVFKVGSLSGMLSLIIWIGTRIYGWFKRPKLKIEFDKDRDLIVWETYHNGMSKKWTRKFLNCQVLNTGKDTAKRCEAVVTVLDCTNNMNHLRREKYAIHWADTPYSGRTTGGYPVDIGSAPQRLDIVFADKNSPEGAWLAIPFALLQPDMTKQVFLPPGAYNIEMKVFCSNGSGDSKKFKVISPQTWTDLDAVEID